MTPAISRFSMRTFTRSRLGANCWRSHASVASRCARHSAGVFGTEACARLRSTGLARMACASGLTVAGTGKRGASGAGSDAARATGKAAQSASAMPQARSVRRIGLSLIFGSYAGCAAAFTTVSTAVCRHSR